MFKNTKYTVKEAKEGKDKNYTVEVEIEPAQVFEGVLEATQAEVKHLLLHRLKAVQFLLKMKLLNRLSKSYMTKFLLT